MKPTLSTWSTLLPFLGCIYKSYSANSLGDDPIVEQLFRDGVKKANFTQGGYIHTFPSEAHIITFITYTNARWFLEMGITIIDFLFIVLNCQPLQFSSILRHPKCRLRYSCVIIINLFYFELSQLEELHIIFSHL